MSVIAKQSKTLKEYKEIVLIMADGDKKNPAVRFINEKIFKQGEDYLVLADEEKMLMALSELCHMKKSKE